MASILANFTYITDVLLGNLKIQMHSVEACSDRECDRCFSQSAAVTAVSSPSNQLKKATLAGPLKPDSKSFKSAIASASSMVF